MLRGRIAGVEQSLYTLCASRGGKGGLLSAKYEVSTRKIAGPESVARLYTGAARDRFYTEGLPRLAPVLLSEDEN
jgi:hypothetical protein